METGEIVVRAARSVVGVPYKKGTANPPEGISCGGLLVYCYRQAGIELPPWTGKMLWAREIAKVYPPIDEDPQLGDILYFCAIKDKEDLRHCGIYTGDNTWIHADTKGVHPQQPITKYWMDRFVGIARPRA